MGIGSLRIGWLVSVGAVAFSVAAGSLAAAAAPIGEVETVAFEGPALLAAARSLPEGGVLRIRAAPVEQDGRTELRDLELRRFRVFAPLARIVLHTDAGEQLLPLPANIYLRGKIVGDPRSRVVISLLASGEIRGLVTTTGHSWLLGAAAGETLLRTRAVAGEREGPGGSFRCEVDELGAAAYRAGDDAASAALADLLTPAAWSAPAAPALLSGARAAFDHTVLVAIETDNEFLNLAAFGGNPATATTYIADLVAYASSIYVDETQTSWALGEVSLWQTADPWVQTASACGLLDFGRYWNNNHPGITRTIAHFLSGKTVFAGTAWIGVLCSGPITIDAALIATGCTPPLTGVSNWGGGYGYTSGILGNFDLDHPTVLWDIQAFSHEIGHNFNSGHTHCYQNVGGNAAAIDPCYAGQCGSTGCYCGGATQPAGCPGSGQGCGTIMSYCHLLSGGNANLTMTLGLGHPYGVQPERVPTRMRDHVLSRAAANPSCLAPILPVAIFSDGFESGGTGAWN